MYFSHYYNGRASLPKGVKMSVGSEWMKVEMGVRLGKGYNFVTFSAQSATSPVASLRIEYLVCFQCTFFTAVHSIMGYHLLWPAKPFYAQLFFTF